MSDVPHSKSKPEEGDAASVRAQRAAEDLFSEANLTKIIKDYMPLVRHAVNRIAVGSANGGILQYEDMVSCGVQGLIEAWYAYDPNKGRQVLHLRPPAYPRLHPRCHPRHPPAPAFAAKVRQRPREGDGRAPRHAQPRPHAR